MESIPPFRLPQYFAMKVIINKKEIQTITSSFSFVLAWLLVFSLTFAVVVWSSTPAHSAGICRSRLEIFGYNCEEHTVTTEDGYILSLQRIPNGRHSGTSNGTKKKIPVFLQHGIMMDGVTWLLNSPEDSLGYILADSGYDVWIANSRGTAFSRQHIIFSVHDSAYWDWSWDELVTYDLPAIYEYVYRNSGRQKIHFVGHSLGTLIALASFSQNKLVGMTRSAALLCPIAYMNQVKSPLARSAADAFLTDTFYWLGIYEFNPTSQPVLMLLRELCEHPFINCYDLLTSYTGKNCCLNRSSVDVFLAHEPQPTSTKNIVHMSQMLRRGAITKFDYKDYKKNMEHYGLANPPAYNLSAIPKHIPLFLSYGGQDDLSDAKDVEHLLTKLAEHRKEKIRVRYLASYAHEDFVMGLDANQLVYDPLISFFKLH